MHIIVDDDDYKELMDDLNEALEDTDKLSKQDAINLLERAQWLIE